MALLYRQNNTAAESFRSGGACSRNLCAGGDFPRWPDSLGFRAACGTLGCQTCCFVI